MGKTRDLFKKTGDTKGTFHAKMSTIKDRNSKNLTETEEIMKIWQKYTEELNKKVLNDPDNHNGVVTHLEPDILEYEVKWALESFTMNKPSGVDGFPAISNPKRWCCERAQYASKFGKCNGGHRTGKGQFSFQSQRKAMPKNAQTTIQLCSFHMLARYCSKSFKQGFSSTWTKNFQMYKLDLEKAEEPEIKCQYRLDHRKN